jgi:hypothetical protein
VYQSPLLLLQIKRVKRVAAAALDALHFAAPWRVTSPGFERKIGTDPGKHPIHRQIR